MDTPRTLYQRVERALRLLSEDPATKMYADVGLFQLQHHACEYMAGRYDDALFVRTIEATERNVSEAIERNVLDANS